MIKLIIIVMMTIMNIEDTKQYNLLGYTCEGGDIQYSRISAIDVETCQKSKEEIFVKNQEIQILQTKKVDEIQVKHCLISKLSLMSYCGMFSRASMVENGLFRKIENISAQECLKIHETHRYKYANTEIQELYSNTTRDVEVTELGYVDTEGNCNGVNIESRGKSYKNIIMTTTLTISIQDYTTTIDTTTNEITFDDGSTCIGRNECFSITKGRSIWNYNTNANCLKNRQDILYQGPATITTTSKTNSKALTIGDVISVESRNDRMMSFEITGVGHLCYQQIFRTDTARISIITKNPTFGFYFEKTENILPANIDLPVYINAKFYYMARNFNSQLKKIHEDTKYASCMASRDNIKNKLHIARNREITYYNIMTDEQGYMTILAGDSFLIIQCVPVIVSLRETNSCHKNLPITYKNESLFLEPIGKTITSVAAEIPCSKLASSVFQINKKTWISAGRYFDETEKPMSLKPNVYIQNLEFKPIQRYFTSGIYSRKQLESFSEYISHPMRVKTANEYITHTIVKTHSPKEDFKITKLLSKDELNKIKNSFLDEVDKKILRWGSYMGFFTGCVLIIQIFAAMASAIINFKFLKSTLGCGVHLLASFLTALTNFVVRNNVEKDTKEDEKSELQKLNVE